MAQDTPITPKPPLWVPWVWTVSGTLGFVATLCSAYYRTRIPPGDPDQHREVVVIVIEWVAASWGISLLGLVIMLLTMGAVIRSTTEAEQVAGRLRIRSWGSLLLHLSPWIYVFLWMLRR